MSNFDPYAIGYSALNALWLGKCARLSYQTHDHVKQAATGWEFERFFFFDIDCTEAFLLANDDIVVLAFRGTEPSCIRDWMTDARIAQVKGCGKGRVHRGFLAALNLAWKEISATIATVRTNNQPLFITGHSLGAALATLAAAKLYEQKQPITALYTFGSPRVGNKTFADWFTAGLGDRTFRFVNNNDLVTRVPPRSFGYCHVGRLLYFDVAGKLQDDTKFWDRFLETVKGNMDDFLQPGIDGFNDHDMERYEKHLMLNINKVLAKAAPLPAI